MSRPVRLPVRTRPNVRVSLYVMASCTLALTEYQFAIVDSQVTHIGGMVNRNILSETLLKQNNSFQRRAIPPTLRQVTNRGGS